MTDNACPTCGTPHTIGAVMSNSDPNLVVEALRDIRDNGEGFNLATVAACAAEVLPHAEAIAERLEKLEGWADFLKKQWSESDAEVARLRAALKNPEEA